MSRLCRLFQAKIHRRIGLIVLIFGLCMGCGGSLEVLELKPMQPHPRPLRGLVLLPIADMTPKATATDIILRTLRAESWLLDNTELPLVMPLDYRVSKHPDEIRSIAEDTDWVKNRSIDELRDWAAVWIQVTENRATNVRDLVDNRKKSKTRGKHFLSYGVEATLRIEIQLLDALTGRRLAKVVIKDTDNPLNQPLSGDTRPSETALIDKALGMLFEPAEGPKTFQRTVRSRGLLACVPSVTQWSAPGLPSFVERNAKKDMIEKQAAVYSLWRRVAPRMSLRASDVAAKHGGLFVTEALRELQNQDIVSAVAGKAVTSRSSLDRLLRGCKGRACKAEVWRGANKISVLLSSQPVAVPSVESQD